MLTLPALKEIERILKPFYIRLLKLQVLRHPVKPGPISAFSVGTGVRIINADKLFTQGNIVSTDNALDLSIDGSGFFQVLMPDGRIGFTRNGSFGRNAEGLLTTASGYVIQPEIAIPEGVTNINVSADGIVSVQNPGEVEAEEVGQFQLADFANSRGLQPIGQSMLVETPASGPGCYS